MGTSQNFGHDYQEDFEKRYEKDYREPITTGWPELDEVTKGGFGKGEIYVYVTPQSSGKSTRCVYSACKALQAGYNYGDTTETFTTRYKVEKAKMEPGTYRSIMGNQALAYGLIAASEKSGLQLFLGSYPITPASDILHELSRYKTFGICAPLLSGQ